MLANGQLDERALVGACLIGERAALSALVIHFRQAVRAGALKALSICGRSVSTTADDLTQQFFLEAFTEPASVLRRFDAARGGLGAWLGSVAFHRCTKMLRSHDVTWPTPITIRTDAAEIQSRVVDNPHEPIPAAELLDRLWKQLSDRSCRILEARLGTRRFDKPLTVKEIAERFNITPSQVYQCVYRIMRVASTVTHAADQAGS